MILLHIGQLAVSLMFIVPLGYYCWAVITERSY